MASEAEWGSVLATTSPERPRGRLGVGTPIRGARLLRRALCLGGELAELAPPEAQSLAERARREIVERNLRAAVLLAAAAAAGLPGVAMGLVTALVSVPPPDRLWAGPALTALLPLVAAVLVIAGRRRVSTRLDGLTGDADVNVDVDVDVDADADVDVNGKEDAQGRTSLWTGPRT